MKWFQFSLRELVMLITIAGLASGMLAMYIQVLEMRAALVQANETNSYIDGLKAVIDRGAKAP